MKKLFAFLYFVCMATIASGLYAMNPIVCEWQDGNGSLIRAHINTHGVDFEGIQGHVFYSIIHDETGNNATNYARLLEVRDSMRFSPDGDYVGFTVNGVLQVHNLDWLCKLDCSCIAPGPELFAFSESSFLKSCERYVALTYKDSFVYLYNLVGRPRLIGTFFLKCEVKGLRCFASQVCVDFVDDTCETVVLPKVIWSESITGREHVQEVMNCGDEGACVAKPSENSLEQCSPPCGHRGRMLPFACDDDSSTDVDDSSSVIFLT